MKIGVLGTGMVGATIATKLIELGQEVMMGSRNAGGEKAVTWAQANGANASQGSYAKAARFGEILFNCTQGTASIEALQSAGADNLKGKILIDVANPLDFSHGRCRPFRSATPTHSASKFRGRFLKRRS